MAKSLSETESKKIFGFAGMKTCVECRQEKPKEDFSKNGKYLRNKCKTCSRVQINQWYKDNKETHLRNTSRWAKENPNKVRLSYLRYQRSNRGICRVRSRDWQKRNPDKVTANASFYRANKINATPSWVDKEDLKGMYSLAKRLEGLCGISYHVDHIVPLNGENICGLHVPWNLQILPASLNIAKSNNYG